MVGPRGKNRDKLLASGLELLSHKGYSATGVQEITDACGVPKGSFYNYFDSKEDFALAVLGEYQAAACERLAAVLEREDLSPLERLRAMFRESGAEFAAAGFAGGCLAGRLAQELAGENLGFRPPLDHTFDCMQSKVAEVLRQARDAGEWAVGESSDDEEVDAVAEFLVNAWQGAVLRAKAAGSERPLEIFQHTVFDRLLSAG